MRNLETSFSQTPSFLKSKGGNHQVFYGITVMTKVEKSTGK